MFRLPDLPKSPPSRRQFYRDLSDAVQTAQPIAGKDVRIDERRGQGTVINASARKTGYFKIVLDGSTMNGTTPIAPCAQLGGSVTLSASYNSANGTSCCNDGNPIPGCSDRTCVFSHCDAPNPPDPGATGTLSYSVNSASGATQTWNNGISTLEVDLQLSGGSWIMSVYVDTVGNINCVGGSCGGGSNCVFGSTSNDAPSSSFNMGSDPTGVHTLDFIGITSGLHYHVVIGITKI
jgi:hypothetical protein